MTIYLNINKAYRDGLVINRETFLHKYEVIKDKITRNGQTFKTIFSDDYVQPYKMVSGTPLIINIEGTYININSLIELCNWSDRKYIDNYINNIKALGFPASIELKWRR